jgi:hypothetical protein
MHAADNPGQMVMLPTSASLGLAAAWNASAADGIRHGLSEEDGLLQLEGEGFVTCSSLCECQHTSLNVNGLEAGC